MRLDLLHDGRNAACIIEHLCRPPSRRTYIQKIMGAPVETVEGISCDLDPKLMGNGRDMKKTVGASRNSRMDQNGVFKALQSHDLAGLHSRSQRQLHGLTAGFPGKIQKIRAGGRHQGASRKSQAQGLGHDLHGGGCSDKRAGSAAGTGVAFGPV